MKKTGVQKKSAVLSQAGLTDFTFDTSYIFKYLKASL